MFDEDYHILRKIDQVPLLLKYKNITTIDGNPMSGGGFNGKFIAVVEGIII